MFKHRKSLIRLSITAIFVLSIVTLFYYKNTERDTKRRTSNAANLHKFDEWSDTDFCNGTGNWTGGEGFHFSPNGGRFDNSHRYLIHDFVQMADIWPAYETLLKENRSSVCMATMSSVGWLHNLAETSANWLGPMSVAAFAPGEDFHLLLRYIQHLRQCHASIREHVTFHVMYPIAHPPCRVRGLTGALNLTCDDPNKSLRTLMALLTDTNQTREWRSAMLYPQNHLRNVARKGCPTTYVFLTDVDIIPRVGLHDALSEFLQNPPCNKCAFVVPTYEVDNNVTSLPENKAALVKLSKLRLVQPFHLKVFSTNQAATNSLRWESLPNNGKGTDAVMVAYPIDYELLYEPFYVANDDVPPHDERFVGYGYTRNSQVFEMHSAGYKLMVLNNAFTMHRGLLKSIHYSEWRYQQVKDNTEIFFGHFKKEIHFRYVTLKLKENVDRTFASPLNDDDNDVASHDSDTNSILP